VLADDEDAVVGLISRLLVPAFDIIASTANGREAVSIVLQQEPDLLVLDIGLPVMHGMDVLALLKQKQSATQVIYLSTFADRHLATATLSAGASIFLFKSQVYSDLSKAFAAVMDGHTFVSVEETR